MTDPYNTSFVDEFYANLKVALETASLRAHALELLAQTIGSLLNKGEVNTALAIENKIFLRYLKENETEQAYDDVYSAIDRGYGRFALKSETETSCLGVESILLVIHAGTFLAHVSLLFDLMLDRFRTGECQRRVYLAALDGYNRDFAFPWEKIGVEVLDVDTTLPIYQRLKKLSTDIGKISITQIVWMCAPLYLPLFSRLHRNIYWWSVKMHPTMPHVKKRIGHSTFGKDGFDFMGYQWEPFTPPEKFFNKGRPAKDRSNHEITLGSFCREELINNLEFWTLVSEALKLDQKISFHYAGRSEIHKDWLKKIPLDESRIKFLGWMSEPHKEIGHLHALLDPAPFGHGVMAVEAVFAKVPIIFSWAEEAKNTPFRRLIESMGAGSDSPLGRNLLGHRDIDSFRSQLKKVVASEKAVESAVTAAEQIVESRKPESWNKFCGILSTAN